MNEPSERMATEINETSLSMADWIQTAVSCSGLTIRDVELLPSTWFVSVVHFMDTLAQLLVEDHAPNRTYVASHFFRTALAHIQPDANVPWKFCLLAEDCSRFDETRCWQVELHPQCFVPLDDHGYVSCVEDVHSGCCRIEHEFRGKHWNELPKHTRVGWRGAMVPWVEVYRKPLVHWERSADHRARNTTIDAHAHPVNSIG